MKIALLDSLNKTMNTRVQNIVIYTLMNLKGTPMASEEFANHYEHTIQHRVVPREFRSINKYQINFASDTIKKLDKYGEMNRDETLSLQILYRDGGIRHLWPIWTAKTNF